MDRYKILISVLVVSFFIAANYVYWSDTDNTVEKPGALESNDVYPMNESDVQIHDEVSKERSMSDVFIPPEKLNPVETISREEKLRELDAEAKRIIAETDAVLEEKHVNIPEEPMSNERNETLEQMYEIVKNKLEEIANER